MNTDNSAQQVIEFWFGELDSKDWWRKSAELDALIAARFGDLLKQAAACELWSWRHTPSGRLAEIIVLDQFSRNIHRDQPGSFAQDPLALALAQEAVACGADQQLEARQRAFAYMPYMHSESLAVHQQALALFSDPALGFNLDFERKHLAIIERFGRYPHRNVLLGRNSTEEELEFLAGPGSSF